MGFHPGIIMKKDAIADRILYKVKRMENAFLNGHNFHFNAPLQPTRIELFSNRKNARS